LVKILCVCVKYFPQKRHGGRIFLLSLFKNPRFFNTRGRWYDFLVYYFYFLCKNLFKGTDYTEGTILLNQSKIFKTLNFFRMEQTRENLDNMHNMDDERRQLSTSTRGFASMDPERQRQIAREGGKAAHVKGTAHEFTPEEARNAGRKGGETVSRDREHMAEIGRKGGRSSGNNRKPSGDSRYSF